ncbi:MAG: EAL domain-containing protein [Halioglobus sp.]
MTVARQINFFFILTFVVLGCLVAGFTTDREYQFKLEQLQQQALADVAARPALAIPIYRKDREALEQTLGSFLDSDAVLSASVHDSLGDDLATISKAESRTLTVPSFYKLRTKLSPSEPELISLEEDGGKVGTGFWVSLLNTERPLHLTVPVFSFVDPNDRGLNPLDFVAPLAFDHNNASQLVIGYVHLVLDRAALIDAAKSGLIRIMSVYVLFTLLCGVGLFLVSRGITKSLSQLSTLADEVAGGELKEHIQISGSAEFRDIGNVLNGLNGGLNSSKHEKDVKGKLLARKVEERESELNRRQADLDKATEEISETRTQLSQMVYYDSLTSLPNRRLFSEQLKLLLPLSKRSGKPLALLFINLDNFKRINDSLGHEAGDRFLQEVGQRLLACLRDSDIVSHYVATEPAIDVSRLGGDEFTLVLNQLDSVNSAGVVAQRVLDSLLQPMVIEGHEVVVRPSIGIAVSSDEDDTVEGMLNAAGTAMHHAKASNSEDFLYYSDDMKATGLDQLTLESDLRKAIEDGHLRLHYQPQIDTVAGSVVGAEALLRWEHPEFGQVPPAIFVRLAEKIGLISALGDWVLHAACQQLLTFDKQGLKLPKVAVNVSAQQFDPSFSQRVIQVLQRTGLPPERLELALAEGILTGNDSNTIDSLRELKTQGVCLSVDDFGTSEATLSYLSRYPLDELRIDRSFVSDSDSSEEGARLLVAIIAMANSLKLRVVAEGVETDAQYRLLAKNGATIMQGYLFSKPVSADDLTRLLAPWHFLQQIEKIDA